MSIFSAPGASFRDYLNSRAPSKPWTADDVPAIVDRLLADARAADAGDVHLDPTPSGLAVRWRLDGVLHPVAAIPPHLAPNVVARLKVLADLPTYRVDVPHEGRLRPRPGEPETRLATIPSLHGERAALRLFPAAQRHLRVAELDYPPDLAELLLSTIRETSGLILVTGPAGSGKTTAILAALREIVAESRGARAVMTLEDPVETPLEGVVQVRVNPAVGLDLASGVRALLRHDPEVLAIGEIRDKPTAETALQAALTGHLVLATFHAGTAADALVRLLEIGVEPYALRAGVRLVFAQRLLRRLCPDCARPANLLEEPDLALGLPALEASLPAGCESCRHSGYRGRLPVVECLDLRGPEVRKTLRNTADPAALQAAAIRDGMTPIPLDALRRVRNRHTSPAEFRRVLGFPGLPAQTSDDCTGQPPPRGINSPDMGQP